LSWDYCITDTTCFQPRSKAPSHKSVKSLSSQRGVTSPTPSTTPSQFSVYSALDQILRHADEGPAIFQPLLQGISLLKNAVTSHRTSHFQPSTTCILTCIRNILIRADCLDRETHTMLLNPPLAAERKRVLDDLSALVAQTRDCLVGMQRGGASDDDESLEMDDQAKAREHAKLLTHAFHVYLDIESFVQVAIKCGIEFPRRRANSDAARRGEDHQNGPQQPGSLARPPRRRTNSASQPNTRSTDPTQWHRRAASSSQSHISASNPTFSSSTAISAESIRSAQAYPLPPSPASSSSSPSLPHFPDGPCTSEEALSFLHALYDDVLDCVSKFVAKVHAYDPGDSAWKGEMVACTSAVVMKIAKMVAAVDAVANAGASTPRLREIKERMYIVANTLVDSVKQLVASIDIRVSVDTDEEPAEVQKRQALQWVTGTLQAASECDTALRDAIQHHLGVGARIQFGNPSSPLRPDASRDSPRASPIATPLGSPSLPDVPEESHEEEEQDPTPPAKTVTADASGPQSERVRLPSVSSLSDSDISSLSRRDSSAVDSTFSARADADSLLSDIAEVQPDEETELPQDIKSQLTRLAIPDRSVPGEGDSDDPDSMSPLEIKILHGDLPPVPRTPLPSFAPADHLMTGEDGDEDEDEDSEMTEASGVTTPSIHAASIRAASIRAVSIRTFVSIPAPPPDVIYNAEGMLMAASLDALVERMTPDAHIVDAQFSHVFFSTFRMFTTSVELVGALRTRYNLLAPPELDNDEKVAWKTQTQTPVRLRVINFIRTWLESQWRVDLDFAALDHLNAMVEETIAPTLGRPATKLIELINSRRAVGSPTSETGVDATAGASVLLMGNSPGPSTVSSPVGDVPRPIVNRSLVAALRESQYPHVSPLDFDPLELARQLTIMESDLFCTLRPEDIFNLDKPSDVVRQLIALSNALTTWVVESVLGEPDSKRRAAVVKFFIKVGDVSFGSSDICEQPSKYLSLCSVASVSTTLLRLAQSWRLWSRQLCLDCIRPGRQVILSIDDNALKLTRIVNPGLGQKISRFLRRTANNRKPGPQLPTLPHPTQGRHISRRALLRLVPDRHDFLS